jgi:hypothetical protein
MSLKKKIFLTHPHTHPPLLSPSRIYRCVRMHMLQWPALRENLDVAHTASPHPSQKRASPKMFTRCQCIRVMHDTLQRDLLVLGFTRRLTKSSILLAVLACSSSSMCMTCYSTYRHKYLPPFHVPLRSTANFGPGHHTRYSDSLIVLVKIIPFYCCISRNISYFLPSTVTRYLLYIKKCYTFRPCLD